MPKRLDSVAEVLRAAQVTGLDGLAADLAAQRRVMDLAVEGVSAQVMGQLLAAVPDLAGMLTTLLRDQCRRRAASDAVRKARREAAATALAQGRMSADEQLALFDRLCRADRDDQRAAARDAVLSALLIGGAMGLSIAAAAWMQGRNRGVADPRPADRGWHG